jgi:pyruvate ferredoxin oxidoreductase gamma subunit
MIEIRFHGRGGQGAVTSAELVALAAIGQGRYAQSMPSFGPERRGAPVQAYLRVSEEPIRVRAEITRPDIVVVLDDGLIEIMDVASGLKDGGLVVVNTKKPEAELRAAMKYKGRLATVDALAIALETLKVPITNTTMIGALLKASDLVPLDALVPQIEHRFNPKLAERNVAALKRAFGETKISQLKAER